jgi:hypothetical protein
MQTIGEILVIMVTTFLTMLNIIAWIYIVKMITSITVFMAQQPFIPTLVLGTVLILMLLQTIYL